MALINKHFGKSELNKYYNRKTIKISYSCMPNLETVISGHTRKLLNAPVSRQEKRTCICRKWPATYIGLASNTFKERFTNHQSSFKHQSQKEGTALSKHVWELKEQRKVHNICWSIAATAPPTTLTQGRATFV